MSHGSAEPVIYLMHSFALEEGLLKHCAVLDYSFACLTGYCGEPFKAGLKHQAIPMSQP